MRVRWTTLALAVAVVAFAFFYRSRSRAKSLAAGSSPTAERSEIKPTDDAVSVVTRAGRSIHDVTNQYRCEFHMSSETGSGANLDILIEAIAKDSFRTLTTYLATNGGSPPADEVIDTPSDVFTRQGAHPWRRTRRDTAPALPTAPVLPIMSGFGYSPSELSGLKFESEEDLDGIPVLRYSLSSKVPDSQGRTLEYWIGANDGLPYKTEEVRYGTQDHGTLRMATSCSFEPVTIPVPMQVSQ